MIVVSEPMTLPKGTIKRIHVVGQTIARNKKEHRDDPCFTVKHKGLTYWCRGFLLDSGTLHGKQDFDNRLSSGAVVWLTTNGQLTLI